MDTWNLWLLWTCGLLLAVYALSAWSGWYRRRMERRTRAWMRGQFRHARMMDDYHRAEREGSGP